tara:strand:- start:888 stop:1070 length:183 start_codon:yes stop_codon:yes gene_type:complete
MEKSNCLIFKLKNLLSITLKTILLVVGLNVLLTTIFVLTNEKRPDNNQKEISYINFKKIR